MTEQRRTDHGPRLGRRTFLRGATVAAAVAAVGVPRLAAGAAEAADPVLHLAYDEANGATEFLDKAGQRTFSAHVAKNPAERVPGVRGNAFRTDGFSTWATGDFAAPITSQLTVQTWVALESYPSGTELPYEELSSSSIIHQKSDSAGFDLGINTYGEWWFTATIDGKERTVKAPWLFPLYEWVHVAAVVDGDAGELRIQLDSSAGTREARLEIPAGSTFDQATGAPLVIGKAAKDETMDIFLVNALDAAYDDTKIYTVARDKAALAAEYTAGIEGAGSADEALQVTALRFADDVLRPRVHAMPPANWTNEPHGLVEHGGKFHLFYQRTPNGPFKSQMHWGHMSSADLVTWKNQHDALLPELNDREAQLGAVAGAGLSGQGSKGIWSGDVVSVDGTAYAFFTTVNYGGPFDPGVTRATSSDPDLATWTKDSAGLFDKTGVNDTRDPYLFADGDTWHMVVGAAVDTGGGLAHYTASSVGGQWTRSEKPFSTVGFGQMDIGSVIWEMPVFEKLGTHDGTDVYILLANPIGGEVSKLTEPYTRGVYWTGTWDGAQFTPFEATPKPLDVIHGHLSPAVARGQGGSLVGIGIVDERSSSQMQLDLGWAHTYSLPREWRLLADGRTLGQRALPALQSLRGTKQSVADVAVSGDHRLAAQGNQVEILAQVDPASTGTRYGLAVCASPDDQEITRIYYDDGDLVIDKSSSSTGFDNEEAVLLRAPYDEAAFGKPETFHVFVDHSVVDVFVNDAAAFSNRIYPTRTDADGAALSTGILLTSGGGETLFTSVDVWTLRAGGA
ncbi:GH32 C-terminal domain-containing protein [Isoptericola sp. F-RaC21]|uniref:GH32 C-terminal domain-containing protein n=1 Tax=Isoptericola sp. F-RaC21 TaxID=3141452 RepID=UPI00315B9691